jgi:hypothetical protein
MMKVLLRATAWWIAIFATSLVVLAQTYPAGVQGGYGGGGCMSGIPTLSDDRGKMLGVWLMFVVAWFAAIELWRLRKAGLIIGAAFLLFLFAGGIRALWLGAWEPMAFVPLAIDALLAASLIRPAAWRACPRLL